MDELTELYNRINEKLIEQDKHIFDDTDVVLMTFSPEDSHELYTDLVKYTELVKSGANIGLVTDPDHNADGPFVVVIDADKLRALA